MTRTLALLLLAAAPAQALTPDELWSAWQAQAAGWGATLGAEAVPAPDGSLTLRNWTLALPGTAPEPLPPESPIQEVTLRPVGGGAVAIDLGLPPEGLAAGDAAGEVRILDENLAITARDAAPEVGAAGGGLGGIDYEVAADSLRVVVHAPSLYDAPPTDVAVEVAGLGLSFPGQLGPDNAATVALSIGGYAYVASLPEAFTGAVNTQAARVEGDLALATTVTLPPSLFAGGPFEAAALQALRDGLALRMDFDYGTVTQDTWFEGFPFAYQAGTVSEPGTASIVVDASQFAVTGEVGGGSLTATSPQLPFPQVDASYGPVAIDIRAPLGPEPGDFAYRVSLVDVAVGEAAWAFVDPEGRLPRDPLRFVVDVGGRATLDAAAALVAEAKGELPPVPSIESLEVRTIEIAGAGLSAMGSGSFTFDNSTGVPVPQGTATARVEGLDRLIDALVALGAVTEEDARNARLGLAAVFRAGDGPDVRVATFEARADGTLLLNGLPVPF